jgi:hypothetical protein
MHRAAPRELAFLVDNPWRTLVKRIAPYGMNRRA